MKVLECEYARFISSRDVGKGALPFEIAADRARR